MPRSDREWRGEVRTGRRCSGCGCPRCRDRSAERAAAGTPRLSTPDRAGRSREGENRVSTNTDQQAAAGAPAPGGVVVSVDRLRTFAADLLCAAGMRRDEAELAARVIVDANVRGVDTHGVFLLSLYVRRMRRGLI